MPQRIVVCFRASFEPSEAAAATYLARALATKERAEAHGATLCAWSAFTFSFDFAPDELEESVSLAAMILGAEAGSTPFMVGVAQGQLDHVSDEGSLASLSWGPALMMAVNLSREASAGEVLLEAGLAAERAAELTALGWTTEPDLRRGVHMLAAAPQGQPALAPLFPVPVAVAPPAPAQAPPPPPRRVPPPPPSRRSAAPAVSPVTVAARQALVEGDGPALDKIVAALRDAGGVDGAERLAGVVALRRGATAEALRSLRAAAAADQPPARRARAQLAYAVALASAGRAEPALLEALRALARVREAKDAKGEAACRRFLAGLSTAAGHPGAAAVWEPPVTA